MISSVTLCASTMSRACTPQTLGLAAPVGPGMVIVTDAFTQSGERQSADVTSMTVTASWPAAPVRQSALKG